MIDKSARTPNKSIGVRIHTQCRQGGGKKKKNGCRLACRSDIRNAAIQKMERYSVHGHAKVFRPVALAVDKDWLNQMSGKVRQS